MVESALDVAIEALAELEGPFTEAQEAKEDAAVVLQEAKDEILELKPEFDAARVLVAQLQRDTRGAVDTQTLEGSEPG